VQSNSAPTEPPDPKNRIHVAGDAVGTWVPVCIAGHASQIDEDVWKSLVDAYRRAILQAVGDLHARMVCVSPLGTGCKVEVEGRLELRQRLYWSPLMSAKAAREAIDSPEISSTDVEVVFAVQEWMLQEWEDVMRDLLP